MAMCVASFTFSGGPEQGRYIVLTFYVSFVREIQVTAIGL
jgi:hypothetical protein